MAGTVKNGLTLGHHGRLDLFGPTQRTRDDRICRYLGQAHGIDHAASGRQLVVHAHNVDEGATEGGLVSSEVDGSGRARGAVGADDDPLLASAVRGSLGRSLQPPSAIDSTHRLGANDARRRPEVPEGGGGKSLLGSTPPADSAQGHRDCDQCLRSWVKEINTRTWGGPSLSGSVRRCHRDPMTVIDAASLRLVQKSPS